MNVAEQKIWVGVAVWSTVFAAYFFVKAPRKTNFDVARNIFIADMAINHLFGALIYVLPWYIPTTPFVVLFYTADQVAEGFLKTSIGLFSFFLGNTFLVHFTRSFLKGGQSFDSKDTGISPRKIVLLGAFFYFGLSSLKRIPSIGLISVSGWTLMIVGICLALWDSYKKKKRGLFVCWLFGSLTGLPLFTMIVQGSIGYSIRVITVILCFLAYFYRPKWKVLIAVPIVIFLGLTVFVNYLNAREQLRSVVWEGGDLAARFDVIQKACLNARWFNYRNIMQLEFIDGRLNQNAQVGLGVEYLDSGAVPFAAGGTIRDAMVALVPRILWPGKPITGGSGSLVTDYTGRVFAEGTSVGVGLPLELYVNYGTSGIVFGFMFFGLIIGIYDQLAGRAITCGSIKRFLRLFIPAVSLGHINGSLAETVGTLASLYVFLFILENIFLSKRAVA